MRIFKTKKDVPTYEWLEDKAARSRAIELGRVRDVIKREFLNIFYSHKQGYAEEHIFDGIKINILHEAENGGVLYLAATTDEEKYLFRLVIDGTINMLQIGGNGTYFDIMTEIRANKAREREENE